MEAKLLVGIISLIFTIIGVPWFFYYKQKKIKDKFKELMSDYIYDVLNYCSKSYYINLEETRDSLGNYSGKWIKDKNWDIYYDNLKIEGDNVNKFYIHNKKIIKNISNDHYNTFTHCVRITTNKKINFLMKPKEFKLKFKKEIDYIDKQKEKYRR